MQLSLGIGVALAIASPVLAQSTFGRSSKRGLAYTPSATHPQDDQLWVTGSSDHSWYYNYMATPSSSFAKLSQSQFEFVPMLWGAPSSTSDNSFLNSVTSLISSGRNITHILTFNGADEPFSQGGAQMDVSVAVATWIRQVKPLQSLGIKAGAPCVTQNGQAC
jgi:hypothetical protein